MHLLEVQGFIGWKKTSFIQARCYKIILKNDMYEAVEERPHGEMRSEIR